MKPLIVIPARLAATRLPGKPLAMIAGLPMIAQVMARANEASIGPVLVAAGDEEIAAAVLDAGGKAVMTDPSHPSGSDRVWEAVQKFDAKGEHDIIINLQGDLPTLEPRLLKDLLAPFQDREIDITTLVAEIRDEAEHTNPSVVKAIVSFAPNAKQGRALYFTRATAPSGEGPRYHHIGVYAYRREALKRFVTLPPSPLEKREKLEQLRAIEAGMHIKAVLADTIPLGVDTPDDLEKARKLLSPA